MISRYRHYVPLSHENPSETDQGTDSWFSRKSSRPVLIALLLSLILNTFLVVQRLHISENNAATERSAYGTCHRLRLRSSISTNTCVARLSNDFAMAWASKSPYFGEDEIVADRLWDDINIDNGTVALADSFTQAKGLPSSQRFPWDQEKGIYLLNGFHSMHCLVGETDSPWRNAAMINLLIVK